MKHESGRVCLDGWLWLRASAQTAAVFRRARAALDAALAARVKEARRRKTGQSFFDEMERKLILCSKLPQELELVIVRKLKRLVLKTGAGKRRGATGGARGSRAAQRQDGLATRELLNSIG